MKSIKSLISGSISKKVAIYCALAVILIFVSLTVVVYYITRDSYYKKGINELQTQVNLVKQMIETFDLSSRNSASQFFTIFTDMFKGDFTVDTSKKLTVVNIEAPVLKHGSDILNLNNHQVDAFNKMTGGSVATIFVRDGDDFIRIATSLKKEDGSRAIGTKLDRAHPAYMPMLKGEEYLGPAKLFGKDYMTKYRPIKDKQGKVIGILFIGFDITSSIKGMLDEVAKIKVGETGYVFILDMKGTAILHPAQKGKSMIEAKDADGRFIIKEFVEKKEGVLTYRWINKELGELFPREKIAVFANAKGFNWVIASGSYTDEIFIEVIRMRNMLIAGVVVASLLLSILIFVITTRLLKPIKDVIQKIDQIIKGDLTVRIKYTSNDEVGQLANMMNKLAESFNDMISGLVQGSMNVITSVDVLRLKAISTSKGAKKQSEQSSAIAAAAEEMNQTIGDIARNASISSETSERAVISAQKGKEIADQAVNNINKVHDSTKNLSDIVDRLNDRVNEIGDIVTVIKDIADQTNLLALNAAIEAARAGEQGRGFAVVADEVRKLAEKTIKATEEISQKIYAVQSESAETVQTMDNASKEVESASLQINKTGDVLNEIATSVREAKDQIIQIATAIEQQSSASQEVAGNIEKNSLIAADIQKMSSDVLLEIARLIDVGNYLRNSAALFQTQTDKYTIFDLAKADHRAFVATLYNAIQGNIQLDESKITDHRNCRFGKWFFSDGMKQCGNLESFRRIDGPHEKIHSLAKQAMAAAVSGNKAKADMLMNEIEELSVEIADLLEKIKEDCKSKN